MTLSVLLTNFENSYTNPFIPNEGILKNCFVKQLKIGLIEILLYLKTE